MESLGLEACMQGKRLPDGFLLGIIFLVWEGNHAPKKTKNDRTRKKKNESKRERARDE